MNLMRGAADEVQHGNLVIGRRMGDISRRAVVAAILASAPAALVACTQRSMTASTPTPAPSLEATPTPSPVLAPEGPLASAEYGPTGRHWPSRTPLPSDEFDLMVEAECDWQEISNAIQYVAERTQEGRGCVLVAPGTLPGYGAGSSRAPVIEGVGSADRASRVLVTPRDGASSIEITDSIRIDGVTGVSFVGFWLYPGSVVLTSVQDVAWAWSKGRAFNVSAGPSGPVVDVELVECVSPEAQLIESDAWAFRTGDNEIDGISVVGCYIAPSYKPDGSQAHCDTLQLSGNPAQNGISIVDSVIFASTNAAFIPSSSAANVVFENSLVVAGDRMLQRYPLPAKANAFTSGLPTAVNGVGTVGILSARGSTFIGGVRGEWRSVVDSVVSGDAGRVATQSGGFRSDPSLSSIDAQWLETRTPMPSDERLARIWSVTG